MGTKPDKDVFEPGEECPTCVDILFGGITPKYVEVDVVDIEKCPGPAIEIPDGTYLLTQSEFPCIWHGFYDVGVFLWDLRADDSRFHIGIPDKTFFWSLVEDTCIDAFVNQETCDMPGALGFNGYVTCWWGPTIGP